MPLLCSGLLLLLKMTNIWPHMLRALPPTIGRHNRAYDADADAADAADGGGGNGGVGDGGGAADGGD